MANETWCLPALLLWSVSPDALFVLLVRRRCVVGQVVASEPKGNRRQSTCDTSYVLPSPHRGSRLWPYWRYCSFHASPKSPDSSPNRMSAAATSSPRSSGNASPELLIQTVCCETLSPCPAVRSIGEPLAEARQLCLALLTNRSPHGVLASGLNRVLRLLTELCIQHSSHRLGRLCKRQLRQQAQHPPLPPLHRPIQLPQTRSLPACYPESSKTCGIAGTAGARRDTSDDPGPLWRVGMALPTLLRKACLDGVASASFLTSSTRISIRPNADR